MSTREKTSNEITANTSAGEVVLEMRGRHSVSIQGDLGGGTLTHFIFTNKGRGIEVRPGTAVEDAYESHVQRSEFVLTGATSPSLFIVLTDIPQA